MFLGVSFVALGVQGCLLFPVGSLFVSQVMSAMRDMVEDNAAVEELEQWRANARAFLSGCAVEENKHTMKKHRTASFHFLRALDHALLGCCG